jgi:hypothetical protein
MTPTRRFFRETAAALLLLPALTAGQRQAAAQKIQTLRIWANAFIPRTVRVIGAPDLTAPVLGGPHQGDTAIPGPIAPSVLGYFLTDQRDFSDNPAASSRMHHLVELDIAGASIRDEQKRCDPTIRIGSLEAGLEECKQRSSTADIKVADFTGESGQDGSRVLAFSLKAGAHNPCFDIPINPATPPGINPAPDIDWNLAVKVEIDADGETGRVSVSGRVEPFPAFEMYIRADGGATLPVFRLEPEQGKTPSDLFGLPNRSVAGTPGGKIVREIGTPLNGVWRSADPAHRFTLSISDSVVTWTEKKASGAQITRTAALMREGARFRVERSNNDVELLTFLDFRPEIRAEIVARAPRPSYLLFFVRDGKLKAEWYGLSVTLNPDGTFKQMFQPGEKPHKPYEFARQ